MAGTLVISNLSDGTDTTSSTNAIKGSAKAWVNFNGVTTASIRASFNVSSVTRNATGDYTVNFTNAMADTSYAVALGTSAVSSSSTSRSLFVNQTTGLSTTAVSLMNRSATGAEDCSIASVAIFR